MSGGVFFLSFVAGNAGTEQATREITPAPNGSHATGRGFYDLYARALDR